MPPTFANGKICYIEIPATDIARSADFYRAVFGWKSRQRGDGHTAFDDTTGEVSGSWVIGRSPAARRRHLALHTACAPACGASTALRTAWEEACNASTGLHTAWESPCNACRSLHTA